VPEVSARGWKLNVGGERAGRDLQYTLEQLKSEFERVDLVAVCQCSGNRRGLFEPHVPGVQWGVGAMGNARWGGVRLADLLRELALRRTRSRWSSIRWTDP
ncbi:MAG TPA: molybdopterin-dependent oxidoreductase, partial [Bryobacteraceae bacterium]